MDELILRSLQGPLSQADADRLEHWRAASARNEEKYQRIREIWGWAGHAAPGPALGPLALPDPGTLIARAEGGAPPASRWPQRWKQPIVAAALFAGVAFSLGILRVGPHLASPPIPPSAESIITTGSGELTTIDLGDGPASVSDPAAPCAWAWMAASEPPGSTAGRSSESERIRITPSPFAHRMGRRWSSVLASRSVPRTRNFGCWSWTGRSGWREGGAKPNSTRER
jgi:hypothetical protein